MILELTPNSPPKQPSGLNPVYVNQMEMFIVCQDSSQSLVLWLSGLFFSLYLEQFCLPVMRGPLDHLATTASG